MRPHQNRTTARIWIAGDQAICDRYGDGSTVERWVYTTGTDDELFHCQAPSASRQETWIEVLRCLCAGAASAGLGGLCSLWILADPQAAVLHATVAGAAGTGAALNNLRIRQAHRVSERKSQ